MHTMEVVELSSSESPRYDKDRELPPEPENNVADGMSTKVPIGSREPDIPLGVINAMSANLYPKYRYVTT